MINCFHHMRPHQARAILASARESKQPLLIYEMGEMSVPFFVWLVLLPISLPLVALMNWSLTPSVRPLTFRQLFFTSLVPLVPMFYAWDGQASAPRMYTMSDFDELLDGLHGDGYVWEKGPAMKPKGKKSWLRDNLCPLDSDGRSLDEVYIKLWERDSDSDNTLLGEMWIRRGDPVEGTKECYQTTGKQQGHYKLDYRVLKNPIATVRVLAIRCETRSTGLDSEFFSEVTAAASTCAEAAGKVIKKSPRPSRKVIGNAFIAVSKVLQGLEHFAEFIGGVIEGFDDEVYMKHIVDENDRSVDGGFFPPQDEYYVMREGDEVYFEDLYGEYFRFPLDQGPVTIRCMEHDNAKEDINIGSLTITPDQMSSDTSDGITGDTVNGGIAEMDGPAVVEIASDYGEREGEGAIYHICYSVGMEDWCRPASTQGQGDQADLLAPEPPFPFPDDVRMIEPGSDRTWFRQVLYAYKEPTKIYGEFDPETKAMVSSFDDNTKMQIVSGEFEATDLDGVVSIVALAGQSASVTDVHVWSNYGGENVDFQYLGWDGSKWSDGPAVNVNDYYWYRCEVSSAAEFYAKDYRTGDFVDGPFKIWAYLDSSLFNFAGPIEPFPFPDKIIPIESNSLEDWAVKTTGAQRPPLESVGEYDQSKSAMHSIVDSTVTMDTVLFNWFPDVPANAVSYVAIVGKGAPLTRPHAFPDVYHDGEVRIDQRYMAWDGTEWTHRQEIATPVDDVYWYRARITKVLKWYAKSYTDEDGVGGTSGPFDVYSYLGEPSDS